MGSFSKTIILGTLGKDVEVIYSKNGNAYANLSVAVNESVKRGDKWEKETTWYNVTVFRQAKFLAEYARKGTSVLISGRMEEQKWEKDGVKHSKWVLLADEAEIAGSGNKSNSGKQDNPAGYNDSDIPF